MTRIEAKYLTKVYKNGAYGLKNCTLDVQDGEFLVIVGASGSGKSTLLKVLAGTEQLSSGELYFDGILSENISVSERDVSMVFQEYVLYPHMTVFDNLATPLRQKGVSDKAIYESVMDTLRVFGLEIAADVKPKNLSGGEQQRVALAKALLKRSKLVLLDEPMSNVDEKSRWEYCYTLKKIKQMLPDSTFVYVTHNTKEAMFLADRIAVMCDGGILQVAPKDLLMKYPEHREVTEILGITDSDLESRFDKEGRACVLPMTEIRVCGHLSGRHLEFAGQSIELDDEYFSRLVRTTEKVNVGLEIGKLNKIPLTESIPLIFKVKENLGDHVILEFDNQSFVFGKKTDLKKGEKIRLYYKTADLTLYDGSERLTCHYPLHRRVEINVIDGENGRIEILGRRIRINKPIPRNTKYARITESGFELSRVKGKCSLRVLGCLDEEFINGKKLNHIAIKGADTYLSLISEKEISCFGTKRVWLNILPEKIEFDL